MQMHKAEIPDILRCNQRDEAFISDLESQLHSILKYLNSRSYHRIRQSIPLLANVWYYYLTSLSNLQSLGEEYAGILRTKNNKIPSNLAQTLWLTVHIGGEHLLDRVLNLVEKKVHCSTSLTPHAKECLLKITQIFKNHKLFLRRIHHSLFYITGKYYNISNRLTGIRYVVLRQWMQDNSFTGSFHLLGQISLFYILFNIVQTVLSKDFTLGDLKTSPNLALESKKYCVLCTENLQSPTATACGHIFCWDCIQDSLRYQKNCPICREEVIPSRVVFLQNYI